MFKTKFFNVAAAALVAAGLQCSAQAQSAPPAPTPPPAAPTMGKRADMQGPPPMMMHRGWGEHRKHRMGMVPFLAGVHLTDAQKDKVFEIMYAQMPTLRARMKEVRKSHQQLHEMAMSGSFDEAQARAIADSGARAMADLAVARVKSANAVYQILTPEQRKHVDECRPQPAADGPPQRKPGCGPMHPMHEMHGDMHGPMGGPGR